MIKELKRFTFFLLLFAGSSAVAQVKSFKISSPNEKIVVTFNLSGSGEPSYTISRNNVQALESSKLGLVRTDGDYTRSLKLTSASRIEDVARQYETLVGKRRINKYAAKQQVFHLSNSAGKALDIIFSVSNDGVAFRYYFPGQSADVKKITNELTTFNFPESAKGWLQPMADAQTGWERSNPSYEENYEQGIPVDKKSPIRAGWVFPALFQNGDTWVLITESASEGNYAGTRLKPDSPSGEYSIGFPQSSEVFAPQAALLPESKLP